MSTAVQLRRGTTAQHAGFTGAVGEVTVDTDKDVVVVHDGATAGGHPLAKDSAIGTKKASVVAGTVDAITATFSPAFASLAAAAGYVLAIPLAGANASTTPTLAIDGLTAKTIVKGSNVALAVGDIPGTDFVGLFVYDASLDKFQMLNPYAAASSASSGGAFKNKIIGGDFTINPWQRGATFTALASAGYAADRWKVGHSTDGVVDILKTADAPTAAAAGLYTAHCLHADVTIADAAIAAGQYYNIVQAIEGLNAASFGFGQAGTRYVTLSFWHKHTKTGTYCVALQNSAANRSYVAEYTQAVSDTWEKATVSIPVDAAGTWLYDTGVGLNVIFALATGSTYQTAAGAWAAGQYFGTANQVNALDNVANNCKFALVQLEAGQTATEFDARSVGQELGLCQRYLPTLSSDGATSAGIGYGAILSSTTVCYVYVAFPMAARTRPTGISASAASHISISDGDSTAALSGISYNSASLSAAILTGTHAARTAYRPHQALFTNASGKILFTGCEL